MFTSPLSKAYFLNLLLLIFIGSSTNAQVGIGTTSPNSDALLDVDASTTSGGILLPRLALTSTSSPSPLSADVAGMIVYNTATTGDVVPGFYLNDGTVWVKISTGSSNGDWKTTGNAGTTAGTNFLGTTDDISLELFTNNTTRMRVENDGQVTIGYGATAASAGYQFSVQAATNNYAILGDASGSGRGVYGKSTLTGQGVRGYNNGTGYGVAGNNAGTGYGVYGTSTSTGQGVRGYNNGTGQGVRGYNNSSGIAVYGANSSSGSGVQAQNSGSGYAFAAFNTGTGSGIYNQVASSKTGIYTNLTASGGTGEYIDLDVYDGAGVYVSGVDDNTTPTDGGDIFSFRSIIDTDTPTVSNTVSGAILAGSQYGVGHGILINHKGSEGRNAEFNVQGTSNSDPAIFSIHHGDGSVILGQNQNDSPASTLTVADFSYTGSDSDDHIAVSGYSFPDNDKGIGIKGTGGKYGVLGINTSTGGGNHYGLYATGDSGASGTKAFMIDHPNDPANKFLKHFSVESNEILNIYRGTILFDANGRAIVQLPDYYSSINKNASYQLTAIGASMPNLFVEKEVSNSNTFIIAGGISGKKVSWVLTAERNDPYLKQSPEKRNNVLDKGEDRGKYLMPQLYNQSKESGMFYKKPKKLKASKAKNIKIDKSSLPQKEDVDDDENIESEDVSLSQSSNSNPTVSKKKK